MVFGANKTPAEVIKESTFGGTDFRGIYSGVNRKWYRKLQKEFDDFKKTGRRGIIVQIIITLMLINVVLNVKHH